MQTEEELEAAIVTASGEMADRCACNCVQIYTKDIHNEVALIFECVALYRLCFIECIVDTDDCSKELLEWGSRVAAANARPPCKIS